MASWWRLPCKTSDIRLDILLACGQSFRWREISPAVWRGVLVGRVWTLRQTDEEILYQVKGPTNAVADCVCLMSLDKTGAIPVDTHVWQIAMREYMPKLSKAKSLTDTIYKEIGDFFRDLWGDYAGWAHSVLFSADLKKFQDLKTPPKIKRTIKVKDELVKTKKAKKR
ncbi:N-glycosylase/DNA lyase-like isoform X2 [Lineus longissimus]|uniref:N-glycosylase/DNA lyase-like isoform X2 n=1 Tax=Lineus longissimus TaxID=88925 RepID=UPI00315DAF40